MVTAMQAANKLQTAFREGRQSFGVWQMMPGANVSRLLARSGVDWVVIDCEHGNIDGSKQDVCIVSLADSRHRQRDA